MCITQVEMLGEEYEEVKQQKNKLEGLENKKRMERIVIIMLIHN